MKILFVAPRFHTNQVGWVRALQRAGHDVIYHVLLRGATENYTDLNPVLFTQGRLSSLVTSSFGAGGENLVRGFPDPIHYFRQLSMLRPDIIVVRDIGRWFSFLAACCGRILGARIVIYSQTELFKSYSMMRRLATSIVLTLFRACWMTPLMGSRTLRTTPPANMFYVPFSVSAANIELKPVGVPLRLLSIGKFEPRKNHRLLLKVLKQLKDDGLDFEATFVGEVSSSSHFKEHALVVQEIDNLNLHDRVSVATNVSHQDMSKYYENADLFILPASNEPASISLLEAMGYGLPVICADTCGTRWYIEEGKTGFIFKDGSFEDLVIVLQKMLDARVLQRMKQSCVEVAPAQISAAAFISAFENLLHRRFGL